jgi:hypothetical protein
MNITDPHTGGPIKCLAHRGAAITVIDQTIVVVCRNYYKIPQSENQIQTKKPHQNQRTKQGMNFDNCQLNFKRA